MYKLRVRDILRVLGFPFRRRHSFGKGLGVAEAFRTRISCAEPLCLDGSIIYCVKRNTGLNFEVTDFLVSDY